MIRVLLMALMLFWPSVAMAGGGYDAQVFWFFVVDCIILFGAIAYFVRPKLKAHLKERSESVARDLDEAKKLKEDAEALLAEHEERMARMEQESAEILERFKEDGEREKAKILGQARDEASRMRKDAETRIAQEAKKARESLKEEASVLAVEMARKALEERMDASAKERLFDEAVEQLQKIQPEQLIQS